MAVETLSKEATRAVQYFEDKLAFEISPIGLNRAIEANEQFQIIDLRTKELFEKSHIPGSCHVLLEDIEKVLPKLNKDVVTVVYCYSITCTLATKAALVLANKGFKVKELIGGFDEWASQINKVESGAKTSSCSTTGGGCG
jgi:rhodanese-related sulfurtransferase